MHTGTKVRYLVFVSTVCADAGEIDQYRAVFASRTRADMSFQKHVQAARRKIDKEIDIIEYPENNLVFESPYFLHAALIELPASAARSPGAAVEWVSLQIAEFGDEAVNVLALESACFDSRGESLASAELNEFWP